MSGQVKWELVRQRLARWLVFGVVSSLLPLMFRGSRQLAETGSFDFSELAREGDLLLVSVVLAGLGLGEVVALCTRFPIAVILCSAGCLWNIVMSAWWYSLLKHGLSSGDLDLTVSVAFFCATLISSFSCVLAGQIEANRVG